jgi:hypothetical protein
MLLPEDIKRENWGGFLYREVGLNPISGFENEASRHYINFYSIT